MPSLFQRAFSWDPPRKSLAPKAGCALRPAHHRGSCCRWSLGYGIVPACVLGTHLSRAERRCSVLLYSGSAVVKRSGLGSCAPSCMPGRSCNPAVPAAGRSSPQLLHRVFVQWLSPAVSPEVRASRGAQVSFWDVLAASCVRSHSPEREPVLSSTWLGSARAKPAEGERIPSPSDPATIESLGHPGAGTWHHGWQAAV